MPSKKARGKARRAAKGAKAADDEVEETVVLNNQDGLLEAQMQRLSINNLPRESDAVQCRHGLELLEQNETTLYGKFCREFQDGYRAKFRSVENDLVSCINAGVVATEEKFADIIWADAAKLKDVISFYVWDAVSLILCGNIRIAKVHASFVCYFEQYIAVALEKSQPTIKWQQIAELQFSDLHTLVKFLRKRIPCKCLDEKYKEVKSMTKIGVCANRDCALTRSKRVAQSDMFFCARCREVCYCSHECQKANWPHHKEFCKRWAREKSEFDAK